MPEGLAVLDVMELYFQLNSIQMNCTQAAIYAASLANSSVCPVTKQYVFL